jgi:hypothetical protein
MRCADDISCFFGRCEIFLWDTMRLDPCLKHGCFQIVGCKGMHERVNEFGRKRGFGGGGGGWCGICWEGARVVGGAWRLRLPSFGGHDIVWSGGSSGFFSCVACEWTLPLFLACNPYATSCFVMSIFLVCDFVTVFACFCFGVLLLRYAIACFFGCYAISVWDRCHGFVSLTRFDEISEWDILMRFPSKFLIWDCLLFVPFKVSL